MVHVPSRGEYVNKGCRCPGCMAANTEYIKKWRDRQKRREVE